tara:strand:+ start:9076 stop:9900 length:825 start_codon:yes stop_codon:yes gene_type:complete
MEYISIFFPTIAMLLMVGAFAGILAGLLGVGGGIVLVPAFFYAFNSLGYFNEQLMQVCVATSLATIVFTSIRSVLSHNKKKMVEWRILKLWSPGIVLGAIMGVLIASKLHSDSLTIIFGSLGILIGLYMAFSKKEWSLGNTMPVGFLRTLISSVVGFLSVLMGIGGGSLAVPLMTLHKVNIHKAVATGAGFGLVIALPSSFGFLITHPPLAGLPPMTIGYINIPAFLIIISMTMITAPMGASLAHKLNVIVLKRTFAFFLISVAINMLYKSYFT